MDKSIIADNISKKYKLYNGTKERLLDLVSPGNYGKDFYALTGVDFQADKGDVIGFVGINGSGKSTLSNIIAGIVPETTGTVETNGQVALIAVASGLKGELTGRDNIELKCLMLGFNKSEIRQLEPEIIEFSELEEFIDQPVKSYSSGMKSRLGFAISVNIDPDILIIDEALSVGDKAFAEKSLAKMKEFKEKGKTMIFVSHSIGQMKQFCEKILWLEFGKVKDFGQVEDVLPKYEAFLGKWRKMSKKDREAYKNNGDKSIDNNEVINEPEPEKAASSEYQEQLTSLLGHIKAGQSYIYPDLFDMDEKIASEEYKDSVYYIKKQAVYYEESYYLLSNKPSVEQSVVGWIKANNINSHTDILIDHDPKTFYIKDTGSAFNRPWGGKKNIIYRDLSQLENTVFEVNTTEKIGKNIWYGGTLNEEQTWIHSSHLK